MPTGGYVEGYGPTLTGAGYYGTQCGHSSHGSSGWFNFEVVSRPGVTVAQATDGGLGASASACADSEPYAAGFTGGSASRPGAWPGNVTAAGGNAYRSFSLTAGRRWDIE